MDGDRTLFRSYSDDTFFATPGWLRLAHVLTGDGGAYGLHGLRGSGKTWAILRATRRADQDGGMGLWFPCPADYTDAAEFFSSLADNLAHAVEQRFSRRLAGRNRTASRAARRADGRLLWQATALRERIRYTTALKWGSEVGISGAYHVTGTFKRTREKDLDERPTTVASLVFDLRRLAEMVVAVTGQPLVIGIDELDKIDADAARALLRDLKRIFEIPGVFFLVSVPAEAAPVVTGRDEFSGFFHAVLEMPPLTPTDVAGVTAARGRQVRPALARLLCVLSVGNLRELIRLADLWPPPAESGGRPGEHRLDEGDRRLARGILAAEASGLLRDAVRACGPTVGRMLPEAWQALPRAAFESPDEFAALSLAAIQDFWNLGQQDPAWRDTIAEPWRRYLIRLFVAGQVTAVRHDVAGAGDPMICDLRDVLIMAGHSTGVALLMLQARFGADLASPYTQPPGGTGFAGLSPCHLLYPRVVSRVGVKRGGCCADIRRRGERYGWENTRAGHGTARLVQPFP
jgi:hypothetical protein